MSDKNDKKIANPDFEIHELFKKRWSPRSFSDKEIEEEDLNSAFEAARWAASCFNEQPWIFLTGKKGSELYDDIFDSLAEGNQKWTSSAPVLGIALARKKFTHNGKPNRHAVYDTGQAMSQMVIQATSLGIYVHQMAGFSPEKVKDSLTLSDEFEIIAAFAMGYLGDADELPEGLAEKEKAERSRKPLKEILFVNRKMA